MAVELFANTRHMRISGPPLFGVVLESFGASCQVGYDAALRPACLSPDGLAGPTSWCACQPALTADRQKFVCIKMDACILS